MAESKWWAAARGGRRDGCLALGQFVLVPWLTEPPAPRNAGSRGDRCGTAEYTGDDKPDEGSGSPVGAKKARCRSLLP